ncbi:unknown [Bacteroides sp. CAG:661]|nr:unknown [Bacteroides sp. CAG:661]
MFVQWAYTPSPCLPADTTKVGKNAAAGCGPVCTRADLCALVLTCAAPHGRERVNNLKDNNQ